MIKILPIRADGEIGENFHVYGMFYLQQYNVATGYMMPMSEITSLNSCPLKSCYFNKLKNTKMSYRIAGNFLWCYISLSCPVSWFFITNLSARTTKFCSMRKFPSIWYPYQFPVCWESCITETGYF